MAVNLQQAISLIKSGDQRQGRQLLAEILKADPGNETAWLWLSGVVHTDDQRRHCLEQVLAINPNNQAARAGLARLPQQPGPASVQAEPFPQQLQAAGTETSPPEAELILSPLAARAADSPDEDDLAAGEEPPQASLVPAGQPAPSPPPTTPNRPVGFGAPGQAATMSWTGRPNRILPALVITLALLACSVCTALLGLLSRSPSSLPVQFIGGVWPF